MWGGGGRACVRPRACVCVCVCVCVHEREREHSDGPQVQWANVKGIEYAITDTNKRSSKP